jgi:hypothetical protein
VIFNNGTTNRWVTVLITLVGIFFLIVPLICDSYTHYLQNVEYQKAHEETLSCRAKLAMFSIENPRSYNNGKNMEKLLDKSCGTLPQFSDFEYESTNRILALYNWLAHQVSFIPL